MEIFTAARQQGKTARCILELAKNPKAILIVPNYGQKRMIVDTYQGICNLEDRVFVVGQTPRGMDLRDYDIIIDELDQVLRHLFGANVKLAALTGRRTGD